MITQTEALIIPHILREANSIIVLLFFENILKFKLSLNACFVSKKTQLFENFNKAIRLRKKILKTIVR